MQVIDYMSRYVIKISVNDTLATARDLMAENNVRHLMVVAADGQLSGIVSDRDCKLASLPSFTASDVVDARFANNTLIETIMTPTPTCIDPLASVEEAAEMLLKNHISALPVMRDHDLIGIITTTDLLRALINVRQTA